MRPWRKGRNQEGGSHRTLSETNSYVINITSSIQNEMPKTLPAKSMTNIEIFLEICLVNALYGRERVVN